jgi:hypothetical protein
MSPLENGPIYFDADASTLAFRAGQLVEKLLLDRGLELSRSSESSIVTAGTIEACIDESLLKDLRRHLNERAEQEPRKVA